MSRLLGTFLVAGASLLVLLLYLVAMNESVGGGGGAGGSAAEGRLRRIARPIPVYDVRELTKCLFISFAILSLI